MLSRHKVAYELYYGIKLPKFNHRTNIVSHLCNNSACVNPKHLKLDSQSGNMQHCMASGRRQDTKGSANGTVILNDELVKEILVDLKTMSILDVVKKRNVNFSTISNIKYNTRWKHIPRESIEV